MYLVLFNLLLKDVGILGWWREGHQLVSLSLHPLHKLRIAILKRLGSLGMGEWGNGKIGSGKGGKRGEEGVKEEKKA